MANVSEKRFSIGKLFVVEENSKIIQIGFGEYVGLATFKQSKLLDNALDQLEHYFSGSLKTFHLPLNPKGTSFQKKVWQALLKIPYGSVQTYGEIAKSIGNPKASRAVGMANHNNPIAIVIPCHRVIGKNKRLTGYAGGLHFKAHLLKLEGCSDFIA